MVEKILNNTTPYRKIRASHEGSLHSSTLKVKNHKALQILRVVSHTDWGAYTSTLLKLYRLLVRSKLDYYHDYWSARKSYLRCHSSPAFTICIWCELFPSRVSMLRLMRLL